MNNKGLRITTVQHYIHRNNWQVHHAQVNDRLGALAKNSKTSECEHENPCWLSLLWLESEAVWAAYNAQA